MAKAKKRVAARKKSSKRGKASVKPTRRKAAKRATPKKAKSKVRRASKSATKLPTEEKRVPAAAETKVPEVVTTTKLPEMTFETTTVNDVIEEPGRPDVVVVEEREIVEERKIA
jgi:hypothetical protein